MEQCTTKKRIVIVRHGDYIQTPLELGKPMLTAAARGKLTRLPLGDHLAGCDSFQVKTSPVAWALETGMILNGQYQWVPGGLTHGNVETTLLSSAAVEQDRDSLEYSVRVTWGGADALVIVPHYEICDWLPGLLADKLDWPADRMSSYRGLTRGMAAVMNLKDQTITALSPAAEE